ncbi:MAG: hypothetical protein A2312_01240 [Candidatus Staskawiczbacteria bacterium RIFOXYB2_FULL_32_9]|uniref:Uncharacterized protein n=1 Tax=Candidatus Staskawiczbacteria bacterium RIFOXYD1_FULL_32_13 TaxID=1802234 RepID=A0A1G2JU43_9BACT|nr:MAG: hypothetical protein UR22_C0003G0033 [Parcubacteria group bacterium GW2011_GWC2_32_10]OGZ78367.1 MAG: hypothetical protein A2360_03550 [Candidatus Staskawiczbacteria bacterium RIFOXYB1_FULL_32_11]OGZ80739.1 MAG: hypothetical protein A2256_02040 [Candidatus Staskawiczbacteria bacterium RIFOXYA2_FULL_32_7]OGZ81340.1 MAG: hypothetical protein A2312_01240 [Candidatus Staskawiczbacteria bacterium RIFOXYB2_FULL_32_9]OGZ86729.1 MAG: hypothetical protein A2463_03785 [Candidatus Staskawiczbacter
MKNNSIAKNILATAGIATLIAGATGAYFLYGGKNAQKNRKKVKSWSLKARRDILEQIENLTDLTQEKYHKIIQEVSDKYKVLKNIGQEEIAEFVEELKCHWEDISKKISKSNNKKILIN